MLTQEYLKQILTYNIDTGVFNWAKRRKVTPGSVAGCDSAHRYIRIKIDGKTYYAHRLAWLYVYGSLPEHEIDHINGNPKDNRIQNLRCVTSQQNKFNRRANKNSTSSFVGVHWCTRDKRYVSKITCNGKVKCLGYFINETDAYSAYLIAKKQLHII